MTECAKYVGDALVILLFVDFLLFITGTNRGFINWILDKLGL